MEEKYEKILKNLYELINNYYNNLRITESKELKTFTQLKQMNSELEQELLEYEVSIYKNIENKLIPFTQILNLKEDCAYTLTKLETESIRHYIGIYNEGNIQSLEEIGKKLNKSKNQIKRAIETALTEMSTIDFQEQLLNERNEIIRKSTKEKQMKKNLMNQDISFLLMTDNLENIFRLMKINTIKDLLSIDEKTIYYLNIQYGYNTEYRILPKRIIRQIHALGLEFKREDLIEKILNLYNKIDVIPLEQLDIPEPALYVETLYDLVSAQQFEPELLNTLDLNEILRVDRIIAGNYQQRQYLNLIEEIRKSYLSKDIRVLKTIKEIIERENPYLNDAEIELIESDVNNMFSIENNYTEEEKEFIKIYFSEEN